MTPMGELVSLQTLRYRLSCVSLVSRQFKRIVCAEELNLIAMLAQQCSQPGYMWEQATSQRLYPPRSRPGCVFRIDVAARDVGVPAMEQPCVGRFYGNGAMPARMPWQMDEPDGR